MKTSSYSSLVKQYFASIAKDYKETAIIPKEVSVRLIDRLQWMNIRPQIILDMGCGGGESSLRMRRYFPNAHVIGIDLTYAMLILSQEDQSQICADVSSLPFRKAMADIIFANLLLPWCELSLQLFLEFKRVLKPGGLLLFSTLGPDSLKEISGKFPFIDMHSIGDLLVEAGFQETVMDVEQLTLHYQNPTQVISDLKNQGFGCFMDTTVDLSDSIADITYEVIYGHAWKPFPASVSINDLARTKRYPSSF